MCDSVYNKEGIKWEWHRMTYTCTCTHVGGRKDLIHTHVGGRENAMYRDHVHVHVHVMEK